MIGMVAMTALKPTASTILTSTPAAIAPIVYVTKTQR
jgi:hypothetical protein